MNKHDIMLMAKEAGWSERYTPPMALYRFAALIAAAERDAILEMSRDTPFKTQTAFDDAIKARGKK